MKLADAMPRKLADGSDVPSRAVDDRDGSTLQRPGPIEPSAPTGSAGDLVGRTILQFRVGARLGEGGMGVVYKAHDDKLRRDVALKVLASRYLADDRNKELIFREARSAAAVTHPNVAAIYDVHEAAGIAFLAMEYVEGETVRARLARGRLSIAEALAIAHDIARGLARAHELGVVHRDLKPDNAMLARDGRVKLLDFGLAKVGVERDPHATDSGRDTPAEGTGPTVPASSDETRAGRVMGTPAYMAPEQARGDVVDARADVFAFGATIYELLTGAPPFAPRAGPPSEWRDADWLYVALRDRRKDVPRAVGRLVTRCLELRADRRFASAGELVAALDALPGTRSKRGVLAVGASIAAAVVAAVIATVTLMHHDEPAVAAPSCDATPTLDARWNDGVRAATKAHLHGTYAADDLAAFDDFAARWRSLHAAACRTPARALGDRQLACLETALDAFAGQLDRPAFALAPDARPALPDAARCLADEPGRPMQERTLSRMISKYGANILSPDGLRYATVTDRTLVITTVATGEDEPAIPLSVDVGLAGWRGARITMAAADRLWFADVARRVVEPGPAIPADTLSVSPDGEYVLVPVTDPPAHVRIVALGSGMQSAPLPVGETGVAVAWTDGQVALNYQIGPESGILVADLGTGAHAKFPYRLSNGYLGPRTPVWRDATTLVFTGRPDVEHGAGLWEATFRHGHLDGPVVQVLAAPHDTLYSPIDSAGRHLLASRITVRQELVRVRDGHAESVGNAPSVRWIGGLDATGTRIAVARDNDAGIVSLADGSYTQLADHEVWIAFDGDRLVETDRGALVVADARTGKRLRTIATPRPPTGARGGAVMCGRDAPGHCAVVFGDGVTDEIAALDGDTVGKLFAFPHDLFTFAAISPDGRRVAYGTANHVEVVELASGRRDAWPVTADSCRSTTGRFQLLAWTAKSDTLYYSQPGCANAEAHLFRLVRGKPAGEAYAGQGWISGLTLDVDGTPILALRTMLDNSIILDGL